VDVGNPELVAAISSEIDRSGPLTFARFMDLALYHPHHGYYTRPLETPTTERIGWSGDFYTSGDVHPLLGQALAKQAAQLDALLDHPDPFTVIEMGPGKGLLARDFLRHCDETRPALAGRLRYLLIERSVTLRAVQRATLSPWTSSGLVSWVDSLEGLGPNSVTGLFFSNELVDALPVHRIQMTRGRPLEVYVAEQGGRFVEQLGPLSTSELAQHLQRFVPKLAEGSRAEVNLAALAWMKAVARCMGRGLVITIDYGHTADDLYGPDRRGGTLLCYYNQMVSDDPYIRVGYQDITSHIDFSCLARMGEEAGLAFTGFTNQMSFLIGLGAEQILETLEPESAEFYGAIQLLRPEGMGRTFKVLIQHKCMAQPVLDGLKFQPFFGTALTQARGTGREAMGKKHFSSLSPLANSL
jgi:SAM-dependent MidA family methyltransferase